MTQALSDIARDKGIEYFLISFTDLFGVQRSKLVPAQSIDTMATNGAGFAGFAAWLDMTPADPDILAIPDVNSLFQLPWQPDVAWMPADLYGVDGQPIAQTPLNQPVQASGSVDPVRASDCGVLGGAPHGRIAPRPVSRICSWPAWP